MTPVKIDLAAIQKAASSAWSALLKSRPLSELDLAVGPNVELRAEREKALAPIVAQLAELGRRLSHGLTIHQICDGLGEQEQRLQELGIPKSWWPGIRIRISGDEKKKRSYKYSYECVEAVLERRSCHWYIVSLRRETCYPSSERKSGILWPADSAAIREKVLANIFPANNCY